MVVAALMTFPVTIDPVAKVAELPMKYGPFGSQSALYCVNWIEVVGEFDITYQLVMYKSVDEGNTWASVDTGNNPITFLGDSASNPTVTYAAVEVSGGIVYVIYTDATEGTRGVRSFDTGTDSWGAFISADGSGLAGIGPCVYRPVDNAIVFITDSTVSIDTIVHTIPAFVVFDVAGGTFGTVIVMDYLDYASPVYWNLNALGAVLDSDGIIQVFSEQATGIPYPGAVEVSFPFVDPDSTVPVDCRELRNLEMIGGGGGGAGGIGQGNAGGGGGGYTTVATIPLTPLTLVATKIGVGGLGEVSGVSPAEAGGDTSFDAHVAGGGGAATGQLTPGGGGSGNNAGGTGGNGSPNTGAGGGGAAGPVSAGGNGGNGGVGVGGVGGTDGGAPAGAGGGGGFGITDSVNGFMGSPLGSGGGGSAGNIGTVDVPGGGNGFDGYINGVYTSVLDPQFGRLFSQSINPDNTLNGLVEITAGETPCQFTSTPRSILNLDCAAGPGFVVVAFSGTRLLGNAAVYVGRGANATDLSLVFQVVDAENEDSTITPGAAVCVNPFGIVYLFYMQAPALNDVTYLQRIDSGSGFGDATELGPFNNPGCRIIATFLGTFLGGTFGTPTAAETHYTAVEAPPTLDIVAVIPGVYGNFITINLIVEEGPGDCDVAVAQDGLVYAITITCGYTVAILPILNIGTWVDVAAVINGSAAGALIQATGNADTTAALFGVQPLTFGTSGGGQ